MSQFGGKDSKRHFTVVMGGKEHGLYVSSTPSSAAKKAVTKLCATDKKRKVQFSIREITQGSKKKTYGPYVGKMKKLDKPIELKGRIIKYSTDVYLDKTKTDVKMGKKVGNKMRGGGIDKRNFIMHIDVTRIHNQKPVFEKKSMFFKKPQLFFGLANIEIGKVPYYKFVAYNSGFGNNKIAMFDEFILNQRFGDSVHNKNININSIPFDDLLILKDFLDKEENQSYYRTIRRAVYDDLETEKRKQELQSKNKNKNKNNAYLKKSQEKKFIFESKITDIINDVQGTQITKLLEKLKNTLKNCNFNDDVINSINFGVILQEYSKYVLNIFLKRKSYNFEQLNINSNIDNIENHLIDKFCEKNSYNICNTLMFKKIGIADEIERIKSFLIDRTKTHFYDDIDIKSTDIDFDEEALNIFKKYGKLENYIETLTSNSFENNNFNSKIFKQITEKIRKNKKNRREITKKLNSLQLNEQQFPFGRGR
jgi:hypothetical protein